MSQSILQTFYDFAKQTPDRPLLHLYYDGAYHPLPWWLLKSKAKHFALGLLKLGAEPGEFFYLLPSRHPHWIYAQLGALTLGMECLSLPSDPKVLEKYSKYPPAFIFVREQEVDEHLPWLKTQKKLRAVITENEGDASLKENFSKIFSFRHLFNDGIAQESQYYQEYRRRRDTSTLTSCISPIQMEEDGSMIEKPLHYSQVMDLFRKLNKQIHFRKNKKLFVATDWTTTLTNLLGFYWPIVSQMKIFYPRSSENMFGQIRSLKAHAALLPTALLKEKIHQDFPKNLEKIRAQTSLSFRERWALRQNLKKIFGRKIHWIMTPSALPLEIAELLQQGGILLIAAPEM